MDGVRPFSGSRHRRGEASPRGRTRATERSWERHGLVGLSAGQIARDASRRQPITLHRRVGQDAQELATPLLRKGVWQRDSPRESSAIAGADEQADTPDAQNHELAEPQRGAQAPRRAEDLVRPRHEMRTCADGQARAPSAPRSKARASAVRRVKKQYWDCFRAERASTAAPNAGSGASSTSGSTRRRWKSARSTARQRAQRHRRRADAARASRPDRPASSAALSRDNGVDASAADAPRPRCIA